MTPRIKTLSLIILLVYTTKQLVAQENTLLWEIKGKNLKKPSYLYATYHSRDSRAHQFGDSVLVKLSKVNTIVVENTDIKTAASKESLAMCLMKNEKLENLTTKDDFNFIKKNAVKYMGMSGILFNTLKPIFTMVIASEANKRKEMKWIVDDYFKREAIKRGKKLVGLESAKEVMSSLDSITLKEQAKMLVDYFKNKNVYDRQYDSIIELYRSQKLQSLYSFYLKEKVPEAFNKNLLNERNLKFSKKIIALLKTQPIFCAVGALHLPGETGLIKLLRDNGYTVTPILNKHTPKQLRIKEKRKWFYYGNDSLLCDINFPNNPFFESNKEDSSIVKTYSYECKDALYKLKYSISIISITDSNLINNPKALYESIGANLITKNDWIKVKDENIRYNNLDAKEIEFNLASNSNNRLKLVANGRLLYMLSVTGYKDSIYSNVAERFFKENTLLNPVITLSINVTDSKADVLIDHFDVRIKGIEIDTILKSSGQGEMIFSLPTTPDKYIITVSATNYVSKKFEINTIGLSKVGRSSFDVLANTSLVKLMDASENLQMFDKPYAILKLLHLNRFDWDIEYIEKIKKEVANLK